jgi:hypothetical protein
MWCRARISYFTVGVLTLICLGLVMQLIRVATVGGGGGAGGGDF